MKKYVLEMTSWQITMFNDNKVELKLQRLPWEINLYVFKAKGALTPSYNLELGEKLHTYTSCAAAKTHSLREYFLFWDLQGEKAGAFLMCRMFPHGGFLI